ncbi:MAG: family 10 glycosylhydrolase, partial [Candidatus Omnitrophica bacterium]|nr:family 10 glycosylhydrolase [Candidatus Omnitrophota bacterium]
PAYGYTEINIGRFKEAAELKTIEEKSEAWQDWKRRQVTELLELLVNKTRSLRPDIKVSATGCMPYVRAYYEAFQDWPSWLKRGLVDFVTIMNYSPRPSEFKRWITTAKAKTVDFSKVNIGVGAYKLTRSPETFKQEFLIGEKAGCGACVIFHYGSLLQNPALGSFLISDENLQR